MNYIWAPFKSIIRFIRGDSTEDEMQVTNPSSSSRCSKRFSNENAFDEPLLKRKRNSPVIAKRDSRSLRIMQTTYQKLEIEQQKKNNQSPISFASRRATRQIQNFIRSNEVIEINDTDDECATVHNVEVEIVPRRSPRLSAASSSSDVEFIEEVSAGNSIINVEHVDQFKNFERNLRDRQRLKDDHIGVKPLKEINNRPPVINGYSLNIDKRATSSSASSSVSTMNSSKSFTDKLSLNKVQQKHNKDVFLGMISKAGRLNNGIKKDSSNAKNNNSNTTQSSRSYSRLSEAGSSSAVAAAKSPPLLDTSKLFPTRSRCSVRLQYEPLLRRSTRSTSFTDLSSTVREKGPAMIGHKSIIDLTDEIDDEEQRQAIEDTVKTSEAIRNLKSSFVGKNKEILGEEYISDLLRRYDSKIRARDSYASKIKKCLHADEERFHKTLSEILEKRLSLKEHEEEPVEEQKPTIELAPITKTMRAAINQIVASNKVPLAQIRDTAIKLQDIRTLENSQWLNDEVINAYMNLIKMRAETKPDKYPKVHCFNTFLYEQLHKKGYNCVRRWTKKIDIFDFGMLIVPIHLGNHWCLIQIDLKGKCIRYFDSMGSPNNQCLKIMMQYLVDEYKDKKNGVFDEQDWKLMNLPPNEIPQQRNCNDCGVFACTFAEHVTRQTSFNFTQDHMPYFRVKMMYEILTGELLL